MSKEINKKILEIFSRNQGYARTRDVTGAGVDFRALRKLEREGQIIKVKGGLYRLAALDVSDELEAVSRIVPDGVVCLFSAWNYYQLSTFVSSAYHLAIEKSHKVALPDYPPIKLYYWSEAYWRIGVTEIMVDNTPIKIYDKEKSVCDAVRFRNKVGKDTEKEVLQSYLRERPRNLEKLLHYARLLRVEKQMTTYLNILL